MHWRRGKREMRVARREAGSRPLLSSDLGCIYSIAWLLPNFVSSRYRPSRDVYSFQANGCYLREAVVFI